MKPRFYAQAVPLGATLGRVELELAAAIMLFALHELGRDWTAPVRLREIGEVLGAAIEAGTEPARGWSRNPFLIPDFAALERLGFAVRAETPEGPTLALTPAALERVVEHLAPLHASPLAEAATLLWRCIGFLPPGQGMRGEVIAWLKRNDGWPPPEARSAREARA